VSALARRVAKQVLAHGLVGTGGWSAVLRAWARQDATVVLTYHRVLEKAEPPLDYSQPGMVVTVDTFERHMAFLERTFDIVPLGALLGAEARRGRRPRCVITFDDGWRDNYELALPVLRKRRLPATIYLTTDFIGTERVFWHTELIHLLLSGRCSAVFRDAQTLSAYPQAVGDCLRRCGDGAGVPAVADIDALIEALKASCDEDRIHGLIGALIRTAGLSRPLFPGRRFFLDWDQVREMSAHGFEIGSHGCTHRIMTRLSVDEARQELMASKAEIERRVGRGVEHFAFPNEDANTTLIELTAQAGYRTACIGRAGESAGASKIRAVRRAGMHEGVSVARGRHEDALLGLALYRAPKSRPA
jgi:peptidoglycan/xylan/chitin deacetylase (PgdA/CDA1 family)